MNMGVLLYYICQWCYSQNSTLNVVRVVFDLPKTSDIILFQTINYIFEISYRFIEFVSLRAPSMNNILKNGLIGLLGLFWSHSETIIDSLMYLENLESVNVPEQSEHPFSQSEVSQYGNPRCGFFKLQKDSFIMYMGLWTEQKTNNKIPLLRPSVGTGAAVAKAPVAFEQ